MNKKSLLVAFLVGTAVGIAVSWKALKTKYERIAQEEINSVKERYAKRYPREVAYTNDTEEEPCPLYSQYKEEIAEYAMPEDEENDEEGGEEYMPKPRVITPEECGDIEEYDIVSLSLHADGVLVDTITGEPIEDVENTVGCESLHHFGEYESDAVHVQNDRLRTYYEILMDNSDFNNTPDDE